MFYIKPELEEIRVPQKIWESVSIGQIFEDSVFVSTATLVNKGRNEFDINTKFVVFPVGPEKLDRDSLLRKLLEICDFLNRHSDKFSRVLSAAR